MKASAIILAAALGLAAGAPLVPRTNHEMMGGEEMQSSQESSQSAEGAQGAESSAAGPEVDDGIIVNYALTLEHLENTFYREGLKNFTAEDMLKAFPDMPDLPKIVTAVAHDEKTHVDTLTKALEAKGGVPVKECTYEFPVTDVKSFVAVANLLEGVGVSAYLGAAGSIADKGILGAAATIATVEARHSSLLRIPNKLHAAPAAFDVAMDFNPVFSLAAPFIKSCPPENPELPFKAFPAMAVANDGGFVQDGDVFFSVDEETMKKAEESGCMQVAFFVPGGPKFEPAHMVEAGGQKLIGCKVPKGAAGQTYAVLSSSAEKADDSTIMAGPAIVECLPIKAKE